jgi:hypothetical protein
MIEPIWIPSIGKCKNCDDLCYSIERNRCRYIIQDYYIKKRSYTKKSSNEKIEIWICLMSTPAFYRKK